MNNLVKVSVPVKQNDSQTAISSTNQSGTGVYYQAMPAVGADGKNVMKLIPVQRVNGQFVRMQNSSNLPNTYRKADSEPQRVYAQPIHFTPAPVSQSNLPVLHPTVNTRYVLKRPQDINMTLNPLDTMGKVQERVISTAAPLRVQFPVVSSEVAKNVVPVASPVLNCGKTITLLNKNQLPVAVKSPVLPNGHYLQIPPNAQVKTLPASALPQAIKKRILSPPVSTHSGVVNTTTSLPTVVYVSPVNTMKLAVQAPSVSSTPLPMNPLPKTNSHPPPGSASIPAQSPKDLSKKSQGPITPIKWVVQEQSDLAAPCLVPQNSSSLTSEILKALAKMENANSVEQSTVTKSSPHKNLSPAGPGKDNALVMCNGKVYFVAKKTPEFDGHPAVHQKTPESPSSRSADESSVSLRNKFVSPNLTSSIFSGLHMQQVSNTGSFSDNLVDEIIDLCDDDQQDECFGQRMVDYSSSKICSSKAVTVDDDEDSNVIFVSYIPPKSTVQSDGQEKERETPQDASMEEEMEVEAKQDEEMESRQEEKIGNVQEKEIGSMQEDKMQSCQEAEMALENITCQLEVTNQEKEITEEMGSIQSNELEQKDACQEAEAAQIKRPVISEKENRHESDQLLKRIFGITAELQICLERIPPAESNASPKKVPQIGSINKRTLDGIRKLIQSSRIEMKTKKLIETQVSTPKRKNETNTNGVKRKKGELHEKNADTSDTDPGNNWRPPGELCGEIELSAVIETTGEGAKDMPCDQVSVSVEKETSASILHGSESMEVAEQRLNTGSSSSAKECELATVQKDSPQGETGAASSDAILPPRSRKGRGRQCTLLQASTAIKQSVQECIVKCNSTAGEMESSSSSTPSSRSKACKAKAPLLWAESSTQDSASVAMSEDEKEPASVEIHCPPESSCSLGGELTGGDVFCATPMDPDEIKRHEKIKRLKELLKEKEAAVELMRKNMT